eukprot:Lankesteria_metandrocarpae@DN4400_c0_g1_i1.p1
MRLAFVWGIVASVAIKAVLGGRSIPRNKLEAISSAITKVVPADQLLEGDISVDVLMLRNLRKFMATPSPRSAYFKRCGTLNGIFSRCPANMFVACGKVFGVGSGSVCHNLIWFYNYFIRACNSHGIDTKSQYRSNSGRGTRVKSDPLGEVTDCFEEKVASGLSLKGRLYLDKVTTFARYNKQHMNVARIFDMKLNAADDSLYIMLEEIERGYCPADMFVSCGARGLYCFPLVEYYRRFVRGLRTEASVNGSARTRLR